MDVKEIDNYIAVGSTGSVCVDVRLLAGYASIVRSITLLKENVAIVEFNNYGCDEGGLAIELVYQDFYTLISSIEDFLDLPISRWGNFTKSGNYPDEQAGVAQSNSASLKEDLRSGALKLPLNWAEKIIRSEYWRDITCGGEG